MIKLRLLLDKHLRENTELFDIPPAFEGNYIVCNQYAKDNGYIWKPEPTSMYGGYYVHPETRNCLIPT
jgi:hypothetical protein